MVSILKDIPIDGVKIVPCRVKGPRGIVKSFLVIGNERLILVDTGFSDADADIIMDAIVEMGHKHSDLRLCVLTHRHGDHTGGLKKLKKTLKFDVLAHELDMPAIQKATGHDVEHVVRGGEQLPDGAGEHLVVSPAYLSSDPEAANQSVKRLIEMNLDLERLLVGHGDDIYEDAKTNLSRIFAGARA